MNAFTAISQILPSLQNAGITDPVALVQRAIKRRWIIPPKETSTPIYPPKNKKFSFDKRINDQ